MKLEDALNNSPRHLAAASEATVTYLTGHLEKDENKDCFRLYLNPHNPHHYLKINKAHVEGEIHQFSDEEIKGFGISAIIPNASAGKKLTLFQVPLKTGAAVDAITISKAKVGEMYPPGFGNKVNASSSKSCSCGGGCGSAGKNPKNDNIVAQCESSGVCSSGCQWCNMGGCTCDCTYNVC